MAGFAFTVIEPDGTRSAQLLEPDAQVEHVIEHLVRTFEVPPELHYRLLHQERPLDRTSTLALEGVNAGEVLQLEVVRDSLFRKILDELYEEAKERAQEQLWDEVEQYLDRIQSVDPEYPGAEDLRRYMRHRPIGQIPPPMPPPPPAAPAATGSSAAGGCFLVIAIVGAIVVAANWKSISKWVKERTRKEVKGAEGKITAGSGGRIEIVDHNSVLDFAYQLYVNGRYVGDVRNPAGGITAFPVTFSDGEVLVELRFFEDNGARDTRLKIVINGGEFSREFFDDGRGPRKSFQWRLEGVAK